jgi:hypothetical protein
MTEDRSVNVQVFRDSTENGEAWIARIQALTVKETTSKAHMQVHTNKESVDGENPST